MIDIRCGGCLDLGAHRRWCPEVVGRPSSMLGTASEELEDIADRIGTVDPGLANRTYDLAERMLESAVQLGTEYQER